MSRAVSPHHRAIAALHQRQRVTPGPGGNQHACCSMLDARCSMLDARCSMLDARCSVLDDAYDYITICTHPGSRAPGSWKYTREAGGPGPVPPSARHSAPRHHGSLKVFASTLRSTQDFLTTRMRGLRARGGAGESG
ncbi:hypothetical protein FIBSPDRAFT_190958 [Athelia psychrophila]|uniref:Uncharacterized protein n=1 Tax=Athelia psychrophila TaxID=1759441 RepID=A0A165ZZ84_9AGAM|nr:hypothetical protein FIBSPDRAFT_190958 [Fibularhizoctonia sp. CBS 109695]